MNGIKVKKIDYNIEGLIIRDYGYAVSIRMNNGDYYPRVMKQQINSKNPNKLFDFVTI
jgi:hypothetical protein